MANWGRPLCYCVLLNVCFLPPWCNVENQRADPSDYCYRSLKHRAFHSEHHLLYFREPSVHVCSKKGERKRRTGAFQHQSTLFYIPLES